MKKLVFEVRRVEIAVDGALVVMRETGQIGPPQTICEIQELMIHITDQAEIKQWISRVGKKIQLVPEDM